MNAIILMPAFFSMRMARVNDGVTQASVVRHGATADTDLAAALKEVRGGGNGAFDASPDFIAVRAPFSGDAFSGPVRVDDNVVSILDSLCSEAPAHVPATLAAVRAARMSFPETPVILVSETAFFADLPRRESGCGLAPELSRQLRLRRTGYHGIFHEAAFGHARRALRSPRRGGPVRMLSICLEPKPEVAAVANRRPVMVTSGATPLEGLPGETSCGEIDASLALTFLEKAGLGPQEIGHLLARESGLRGMTGRDMTFRELFESDAPECAAAREVFRYRLLLACGAGIAALSGLDGMVFSGRHAPLAHELGPWLATRLRKAMQGAEREPPWYVLGESLEKLIADQAAAALRAA